MYLTGPCSVFHCEGGRAGVGSGSRPAKQGDHATKLLFWGFVRMTYSILYNRQRQYLFHLWLCDYRFLSVLVGTESWQTRNSQCTGRTITSS